MVGYQVWRVTVTHRVTVARCICVRFEEFQVTVRRACEGRS
jgi:hypothetical protein